MLVLAADPDRHQLANGFAPQHDLYIDVARSGLVIEADDKVTGFYTGAASRAGIKPGGQ